MSDPVETMKRVNHIMTPTEEYIDRAGHALKEVFSDFIVVGIPIDKEAEPVMVQFGNPQAIKAITRIAEEKVNGDRNRKFDQRYRSN